MTDLTIEFVQGNETHSSNWGKYYVKGLEKWQVSEDFPENCKDNHHSYQGYVASGIEEESIFTIFEQNGDKRGTDEFFFSICKITGSDSEDISNYGKGFCKGNFEIIVRGEGKTKAPRLMKWWIESSDNSLEFAEHCAKYIEKRGIKELPSLATTLSTEFKSLADEDIDKEILEICQKLDRLIKRVDSGIREPLNDVFTKLTQLQKDRSNYKKIGAMTNKTMQEKEQEPIIASSIIYTFGYGNRPTTDNLLGFLREYEIPYLIDVRLRAKAWTRRWWGDKVKEAVESVGVSYLPRPDLGNTSGTAEWINPDEVKAVLGLTELRDLLLEKGSIMLMCAELDYKKCHRTAIANKLQEMVQEKTSDYPLNWTH